jgi:tetratricopeptide (TPR) repeat protein
MANLGFGSCGDQGPWRVGANENTTVAFSHDVEVEGKPLAAGKYGLHMIPGEESWTVIFSDNSTSWGSFFYDAAEDALRVTVTPEKAEYREWLTFDFADRQLDSTVLALEWENLRVPIEISLPDAVGLYVASIEDELRNSQGFTWQSWNAAAQFLLQRDTENVHIDQALAWAEQAVSGPFGLGQKSFITLQTKAQVLARAGREDEAQTLMVEALDDPTATPFQIHAFGRQLIGQGELDEAMKVFRKNAERFPGTWPVHVGLARGYSALGDYGKALEHARMALANAPDEPNRNNVQTQIDTLEQGQDIN